MFAATTSVTNRSLPFYQVNFSGFQPESLPLFTTHSFWCSFHFALKMLYWFTGFEFSYFVKMNQYAFLNLQRSSKLNFYLYFHNSFGRSVWSPGSPCSSSIGHSSQVSWVLLSLLLLYMFWSGSWYAPLLLFGCA